MKKNNIFLLVIVAVLNIYSSCEGSKKLTKPPVQPPQEEVAGPIVWRQSNFNTLRDLKLIKDTVNFFLSDTLKFWGPPKYEYYQGKVQQVDTMIVIPPLTPGKITGTPEMAGPLVIKFKLFFEHSSLYPVSVTVNPDKSYSVWDNQRIQVLWFLERKHEMKVLSGKPVY